MPMEICPHCGENTLDLFEQGLKPALVGDDIIFTETKIFATCRNRGCYGYGVTLEKNFHAQEDMIERKKPKKQGKQRSKDKSCGFFRKNHQARKSNSEQKHERS